MLDEALKNVAVIGAAGKMGSGIALLLLNEMACRGAEVSGRADRGGRLVLIDQSESGLNSLSVYLKVQMTRLAEKNIMALRLWHRERAELVDNGDIITAFVNESMGLVFPATEPARAVGARLVFEAVAEDLGIKAGLFRNLDRICGKKAFFLTNTSSIPIGILAKKAGLGPRLIGCHFYNPPAVQKLVEVIAPPKTSPVLKKMVQELCERLRKTAVASNDITGFIGNGHFIRDALFGLSLMEELAESVRDYEALYRINRVSQEFMVRPMGIFQLMDYVGLDVCQRILAIMRGFGKDPSLQSRRIDRMMALKIRGGQHPDGSQKDGFFRYEKGRPAAVFSVREKKYVPLDPAGWTSACDQDLGPLPQGHAPWRALSGDSRKEGKLWAYFRTLFQTETRGALLARRYLLASREIGLNLVKGKVAASLEDVNAVLVNGFYHLYGPKNDYY